VLAVIDDDGPHEVVFPCRQIPGGWLNAESKTWVPVRPTHWRELLDELWVPPRLSDPLVFSRGVLEDLIEAACDRLGTFPSHLLC